MKKLLIAFCICFASTVYAQDTLTLRVMTYNLRFGELASLEELASHIKSFKPDFVALQEVDCNTHRERSPHQHGKNFISELAYHTGMFGLYGKTIDYTGGYYGIGLLSKYPCISSEKVMLPQPEKKHEQRVLLKGLFELSEKDTIVFASTHLDVKLGSTRSAQALAINELFENSQYPVVLGGDFNATPASTAIKKIMKKSWFSLTNNDKSWPAHKPKAKIDYLFAQPMKNWKVISTQTIDSQLSDHLPIVSEIQYIKY